MKISPTFRGSALLVLLALLAGLILLPGCLANLCKLRLYLYRDVEQKSLPPAQMALLITDPAIVAAVLPEAAAKLPPQGLPWAPEQPNYDKDYYRLSIDGLDGHPVYQGRCLNVTITDICEVRPGARQVMARLELFGPSGQQSSKDAASLTLEPAGSISYIPIGKRLRKKRCALKPSACRSPTMPPCAPP